jgi:ADP-heptose:LPS heptosyltransferase
MRRVCVVRFGGMGDILLATPAVRALSRHFGTTEIDFIVGKGMADALTGIPYIRRVITFNKDGKDARAGNFVRFLGELRKERYDLFLNLHPSAKTVAMALASGAPRVLTFRKDRRKQPDTGRVRHAIDDFTKELAPLGIGPVTDRRMDFFVPAEAHEKVAVLLASEGIGPGDPLLVANPAATRDINRWPPDRFAALFDRLAAELPALRLVLSGGPKDKDLAAEVLGGLKPGTRVVDLAGRVSVKELGALLARADVVVTGDTGPLHIASAVGAPLVCLSGAADPDRTGPTAPRDLVVINRDLPCVPCQDRRCRRGDIACMTQMPVDWVFDAVKRRLATK